MSKLFEAKNLEIRNVVKTKAFKFLKENGLRKYNDCTHRFGLFHNDELIQIICIEISTNEICQYEITNVGTKTDCFVKDGYKKLWEYFVEKFKPTDVSFPIYEDLNETEKLFLDNCGFKNKYSEAHKDIFYKGNVGGTDYLVESKDFNKKFIETIAKTKIKNKEEMTHIINCLGFKKVTEINLTKCYVWFVGGVVYRMTAPDGKFYIGSTTKDLDKYFGSGVGWNNYLKEKGFDKRDIKKEIIRSDARTEKELRKIESEEIKKYFVFDIGRKRWKKANEECLNINPAESPVINKPCPECGATKGMHKFYCSHSKYCPECGYNIGSRSHDKNCPFYKEKNKCDECGCILTSHTHKPWCSHYVSPGNCPECGYDLQSRRHAPTCSHYKEVEGCPECGSKTLHKPWCSRYKEREACPECGSKTTHKEWCSQFKPIERCPYCGSKSNHKKGCPNRKEPEPCPICGCTNNHKKGCPNKHSKECEFCGSISQHKSWCPKYKKPKKNPCKYCGSPTMHKKGCPNNRKFNDGSYEKCEECGWLGGYHSQECSHNQS